MYIKLKKSWEEKYLYPVLLFRMFYVYYFSCFNRFVNVLGKCMSQNDSGKVIGWTFAVQQSAALLYLNCAE